ncbi:MAG: class I SAM-dependent methyltransferase [Proteobacteria bacterium]|nr:class I SAM-dependent methyltransferase [Pseudomonadota bacterium]
MYVTKPPSQHFDREGVLLPEQRGGVAWSQFNRSYAALQTDDWRQINASRRYSLPVRALRWVIARFLHQKDALRGLGTKRKLFAPLPVKRDPDIVFFGAEVGWEASLLQALFGDGGRVVLVDADPAAYQRYLDAPRTLQVGDLTLTRDPDRIEYVQADFFDWQEQGAFDVGLDWGLIEHFKGERKHAVLQRFAECLRPDGLQITAVPRDTYGMRAFYWLFADELNFGYRELHTPRELATILDAAGLRVVARHNTPDTCVVASRPQ